MIIHQYTQMGTFHENHCEDYTIFADLETNRILMAVMDGCTMGKESYFAYLIELGNERMFAKKLYQLEGNYNVKPTDDLGIVRMVLNSSTETTNDKYPTREAC